MKRKSAILWFRNDLRLHDNEALLKALQNNTELIPLYCIDERLFKKTSLGFRKTEKYRANFLLQSLKNLKKNLQKLGSDLLIRIGKPEEIIPDLAKKHKVNAVYTSKEITAEEITIEEKIEFALWQEKISLELFWASTLYHLEDLPFPLNNLPDIFTNFRKQIEKYIEVRPIFPYPQKILELPAKVDLGEIPCIEKLGLEKAIVDKRAVLKFEGGEDAALKRLNEYFWEKDLLKVYKETRNGLLGADYSSKFSPWLALGCISPRMIYQEVKRYEENIVKNQSTYWLIFELLWRDYFKFVAKKYGNKLFTKGGIQDKKHLDLNKDKELFEKWKAGETGISFIDANMKELKFTGFMSNRGRQNVASFLVKDWKIDWRWGASYFEAMLIDYDVCSNWGNWNYIAGVGNDPRENRKFNIASQAKRYDPKELYINHWLS